MSGWECTGGFIIPTRSSGLRNILMGRIASLCMLAGEAALHQRVFEVHSLDGHLWGVFG